MLDRRTLLASATALSTAPALESVFAPSRAALPAAGSALNALFDQFMAENLDNSPMTVTSLGLDKGARAAQKSRLDDVSPAGLAKTRAITRSQLSRLKAFNRAQLGPKDQVSYDVVLYGLAAASESNSRFAYGAPGGGQPYQLCQLTGIYSEGPSFLDTQHIIETKADADAYLARLEALATVMEPGDRGRAP